MIKLDYQKDYNPEGLPFILDGQVVMVQPWGQVLADSKSAWARIQVAGKTESMISPVLQISAALPHLMEIYGSPAIQMFVHNVTLAIEKQYMSFGREAVQKEWADQVRYVSGLHPQYSALTYTPPNEIANYGGLVFMSSGDYAQQR